MTRISTISTKAQDLKRPGILIAGLFFILSAARGQSPETASFILDRFNQYKGSYVQEEIYAHTDRNSYLCGETCWFRLYYVDALYLNSAGLSQLAYVELLDRNNLPVLQQKVSLKPESCSGSLIIPDDIPSGTYRFRVYTSWMKNFDPEYFFEKPIRIINPGRLPDQHNPAVQPNYDIQFFPEGGNLVQGIGCTVAFRMTDTQGHGVQGSGILLNQKGDTILNFHSGHLGLGHFRFTPEPDEQYRAIISINHQVQPVLNLPPVYAGGYVLHLEELPGKGLQIQVSASPDLTVNGMRLFIHGHHIAIPEKKIETELDSAMIAVNPDELEDGINQITLFTKNGQPVCERLYFKKPGRKLTILLQSDSVFRTRRKVNLNLATRDQSGKDIAADMSMAVYRLDSLRQADDAGIRAYFYLEAELGPVESPEDYLDPSPDRDEDRDNLMMTRGWRRFNWRTGLMQQPVLPVFPPEVRGHIVHGKLSGPAGVPVYRVESFLSVPSRRSQLRTALSDTAGNLKFELTGFYGTEELIVQTGPRADSSLHIELLSPFSEKHSGYPLPELFIPGKNSRTLLYQSVRSQVQQAYEAPDRKRYKWPVLDSMPFYVQADESYLLDNYVRFLTMEEVLREYVASLNVARKNDRFELFLMNRPRQDYFHDEPLILIDGVPFFDTDEFFRQDPKKIKRLDLVNRQYALGSLTFNGIISATTYQGNLEGIQLNGRATILDYPGIPVEREFFSPVYDTEAAQSSRIPDYRTLLYWTPKIKYGDREAGANPIGFYSSDIPGKYVVVVEGLTDAGVPGRALMYFEVKK